MAAARPLLKKITPSLQRSLLLPNYPGIQSRIRLPTPYLRGGDGKDRVVGDVKREEIWGKSIAELWKGKIEDDIDPRWQAWVESRHKLWKQKDEEHQRRDLQINWAVLDQHEMYEKMRPWIGEEIMELLKKERPVWLIRSSTASENKTVHPKFWSCLN
ncbi:hypothetical protein MKW98_019890 [Papaver atlanticum]|uniref:Uncharacterized protein n=1 Tax=Papaver atlanticum TaxID=357466 RepID=A0AAD4S2F9_9MAGN|nr:hypothetical protein MKW98_019890 [Papaver atlanticum]